MSRIGYIFDTLNKLIGERREKPVTGSYTNYLLSRGEDKILAKLNEECGEFMLAVKSEDHERILGEAADLCYHLLLILNEKGIALDEVSAILEERRYQEELRPNE